MSHITKFINDPYEFIENTKVSSLVNLAKKADKAYYSGTGTEPLLTDLQYDLLRDSIREKDPNHEYLNNTGASVETKVKVDLPHHMGSMFKPVAAEIEKFIIRFKKKYPGPYMISSKLDGVSGLLEINLDSSNDRLMTKGRNDIGTDVSNLLSIIDIKYKLLGKKTIYVRGEMIMKKETFVQYKDIHSNPRNTVAGVINSKTIPESEALDTEFIAYEIVEPWLPYNDQMKLLKKLGLRTVYNEMVDDFDLDLLIDKYRKHIKNSPFECDGIIIAHNNPQLRATEGDPKYAFAFKNIDDLETKDVKIKKIIWNISKDGYYKPVITFDTIELAGVNVHKATAFNAKYIYGNNLGPGAIITMVRSGGVIPYIKNIVKEAKKPQMPLTEYEWNATEVDILTLEHSEEQKAKELLKFCSTLKIRDIAESSIKRFIDAEIDTIDKIISITKDDLRNVSSFKVTMVNKIYNAIHEKVNSMTLCDLMVATNIFGRGFGKRIIAKILKEHPDIIFQYIEKTNIELIDVIKKIEGFAEERSTQFVSNIKAFLDVMANLPDELQDRILFNVDEDEDEDDGIENIIITNDIKGKKFVFSGKRHPEWEKVIVKNGGERSTSVTSKSYMLVADASDIEEGTNNKIKSAIKHDCRLLSKEEFVTEFIE